MLAKSRHFVGCSRTHPCWRDYTSFALIVLARALPQARASPQPERAPARQLPLWQGSTRPMKSRSRIGAIAQVTAVAAGAGVDDASVSVHAAEAAGAAAEAGAGAEVAAGAVGAITRVAIIPMMHHAVALTEMKEVVTEGADGAEAEAEAEVGVEAGIVKTATDAAATIEMQAFEAVMDAMELIELIEMREMIAVAIDAVAAGVGAGAEAAIGTGAVIAAAVAAAVAAAGAMIAAASRAKTMAQLAAAMTRGGHAPRRAPGSALPTVGPSDALPAGETMMRPSLGLHPVMDVFVLLQVAGSHCLPLIWLLRQLRLLLLTPPLLLQPQRLCPFFGLAMALHTHHEALRRLKRPLLLLQLLLLLQRVHQLGLWARQRPWSPSEWQRCQR